MFSGPSAASLISSFVIASYNPLDRVGDASLCSQFYYGSIGLRSFLWLPRGQTTCSQALSTQDSGFFARHPVIPLEKKEGLDLFWLERALVDESLVQGNDDQLDEYLDQWTALPPSPALDSQRPLLPSIPGGVEVITKNPVFALLRVDPAQIRSLLATLPPQWKGRLLSSSPEPFVPVSRPAVERVREILAKVRFDPGVASIVNNISIPQMRNDIRFLTGEDGKSGIESRHSFSDGILVAAEWIKDRIADTGAKCELRPFLQGFGPNVIWYASSVLCW